MVWHFGSFRLDQANAELWRAEQAVILRPKTFFLTALWLSEPIRTEAGPFHECQPDATEKTGTRHHRGVRSQPVS